MSTEVNCQKTRRKIVPANLTIHNDFPQQASGESEEDYEISILNYWKRKKELQRIKEKKQYHQKKRKDKKREFVSIYYRLDFTPIDF